MNRSIALAVVGLGLVASPLYLRPADSAVPTNPKIALIDMQRTLTQTPVGKRASDMFDKELVAKQAELDKQKADLKKADADLDKEAAIMKPEMVKQKKDELEKQFVQLQQTYVKLERDLAGERQKLIADLVKRADPIIAELGKAEGVQVVLDSQAVLWFDSAIDLTPKLQADKRMQ